MNMYLIIMVGDTCMHLLQNSLDCANYLSTLENIIEVAASAMATTIKSIQMHDFHYYSYMQFPANDIINALWGVRLLHPKTK